MKDHAIALLLAISLACGGGYALAQETSVGSVVELCPLPPDGVLGNCLDLVPAHFASLEGATPDEINQEVADLVVALASLVGPDTPPDLCIELSESIRLATLYSSDAAQREALLQLAETLCLAGNVETASVSPQASLN